MRRIKHIPGKLYLWGHILKDFSLKRDVTVSEIEINTLNLYQNLCDSANLH